MAEDVLADVIELLKPRKDFLLEVRGQGGRIHTEVSSFGYRNYTLELPPYILATCAELGLSIVHDVYPCAQGI